MASAPAKESLGDSVKKMVRSVLLTERNGLSVSQLQDIYREFVNGGIPFQKLGFSSLESYLKSIPDAARVARDSSGQVMCYAVADQSTKHIESLVQRTKSRKKRSTRIPRRSQRQGPPPGGKGAPWKRPQQRNGYRGPPSKPSQPPPTRKPLTNLNENGANVKPPRGRGIGRTQKTAHDVPPRFRKKSGEDQFTEAPVVTKPKTPPPVNSEEVAIGRICELLDNSANGIYMADLPKVYESKYKETVSLDLVDKLAALDICHKEHIVDNHYIIYKKLVITTPRDRFAPRQISDKNVKVMSAPTSLPVLTLPDEDELEVFVSLIYDTSHFYCYIIGEEYSEKLSELEEKMMQFYSEPEQLVLEGEPLVGHYYAAQSGKDWLRAKVEDIYDGVALCRFADHGDKEEIEFSDLRHLPNRFCLLPEQSIACYLDKLSNIEIPESGLKRFLLFALGKSLIAEVCSRDDPMRVILYNDSRCINDDLLNIVTLGNSPDE